MPTTFIADDDLGDAAAVRLGFADHAALYANNPRWQSIVLNANQRAFRDIYRVGRKLLYSDGQIRAWDDGPEFNRDLGLSWVLDEGRGLSGLEVPVAKRLDRLADVAEAMEGGLLIDGVLQPPAGLPAGSTGRAGRLTAVTAGLRRAACEDPLRRQGRWGERWDRCDPYPADGVSCGGGSAAVACAAPPEAFVTDTYGPVVTFDIAAGRKHQVTLGGDAALAVTGDRDGAVFEVRLQQDGTGGRRVAWWAGISWTDGVTPTLTTTPGKADAFGFVRRSAGAYDGFVFGLNL